MNIKISVLDLAPIVQGGTATDSFRNTLDLAQHAEKWGYNRYWLAEHHNMAGVASSATSVVIGYVAGGTSRIRVGSGGIMLPNHAPLVIAEQFGTLASMYPGRIDLGLGRAPGTDQLTARALRRDLRNADDFPEQLEELRAYFAGDVENVRAVPGEGLDVPIWLLGSSGFSARLAGQLGLPFAFASHFSPDYTLPAIEAYRSTFTPSPVLDKPYVMVGANVIVAETDEKARYLATSQQQQFLNLIRGRTAPLQPPVENMDYLWSEYEKAALERQFGSAIVGSRETVKAKLEDFVNMTGADEVIASAHIFHHDDRLHSYEMLAEIVSR
ncbi:LLM class flavin-dependent oxidoreductase [Ectobacillus sp. JY-23]|uniref:LLM class flavin-dependent oxidoreductase n=1 Tax=Ectobacillus sp. JY-23 TaxID=2933872 RepID=UPI001FF44BD4|nr:LLM class flavin-dependent oxidoreductase [Ectobacillus sp. JY-23]UOY92724.1 LLM class flavin-dependent oxidoreductase [Ectobacillus sp. JY-23]